MARRIIKGVRGIIDLFGRLTFPEVCCACHGSLVEGEKLFCLECLVSLPRTELHRLASNLARNPMLQRLAMPSVPIEKAAAWFYYTRTEPHTHLIHDAKYRSMPRLARQAGRMYADEIAASGFFDGVDMLMPVPLSLGKLLQRGYNQSLEICRGIGEATDIRVADNLYARKGHSTQTRKSQQERSLGLKGVFAVERPAELENRHVLLVDDVCTTGATLRSCLEVINSAAPSARLSVLTLGLTGND